MLGINIGIDLGTTAIVIFVQGKGIVLSEPNAAAYDSKSGKMLAVGKKAYNMLGRNPSSIKVVLPIRDGVVSDFPSCRIFCAIICKKYAATWFLNPTS